MSPMDQVAPVANWPTPSFNGDVGVVVAIRDPGSSSIYKLVELHWSSASYKDA